MQFGAVTDIGMHRKINEDNYYVNESDTFPYAVVADGMGGHQAGDFASRYLIEHMPEYIKESGENEPVAALRKGIEAVNQELCRGRRSYTSGVYIGEQYHIQLCKESL